VTTRTSSRTTSSKPAPKPDPGLTLRYLPLSELQRWPRNPKEHDKGLLRRSMAEYGFTVPLLRDERTGRLVAGHGRLEILEELKRSGAEPPRRIRVERKGGEWLVPVLFGVSFATEEQAERYLLLDNRSTELGGWNAKGLAEIFNSLEPTHREDLTGFTQEAIDELLLAAEGKKRVTFEVSTGEGAGGEGSDDPKAGSLNLALSADQNAVVQRAIKQAKAGGAKTNPEAIAEICRRYLGGGQ